MTVLVPGNTDLKPAIIYFPGGGFTSADYEKYSEMRTALAEAGFVVATAEYRVVPDKFLRWCRKARSRCGICANMRRSMASIPHGSV